jgi:hypothetical protein
MRPTGKLITICALALLLVMVKEIIPNIEIESVYSTKEVFNLLKTETKQKEMHNAAVELNYGKSSNACVYFVSEVLRRSGVDIPKATSNTKQLTNFLKDEGWKRYKDYKELKPGDLCFTTDHLGNKNGIPTHTYIFMSWVKEGNYDYAYICDNQAKDYEDKTYHIRNIKSVDKANGFTKDAFSFFMRPDK